MEKSEIFELELSLDAWRIQFACHIYIFEGGKKKEFMALISRFDSFVFALNITKDAYVYVKHSMLFLSFNLTKWDSFMWPTNLYDGNTYYTTHIHDWM